MKYESIGCVMNNGLIAFEQLAKEQEAISSPKKFKQFCLEESLEHIQTENVEFVNGIFHNDEFFELYATRKQKGYCAQHIGAILDGIRQQNKKALIIDIPRNKRLIFSSRKRGQ